MKITTRIVYSLTATVLVGIVSSTSYAQFDPRYYPECYAPLETAREEVPKPPADISGTLSTASTVASVASRFGGFGGLGGLGGGAAQAVQTVQTVNQYSGLIADVAAFTAAMQEEFPELGLRFGAYGARLGEDADLLISAGTHVTASQDCYQQAYSELSTTWENEELRRRDVNRQHREIERGLEFADEILADAKIRVNKNIESYNDALQQESEGAGISLSRLAGLANSTGMLNQLSSSISQDVLMACRNTGPFGAAAANCAQLSTAVGSGDLCPSGSCSLSEMRARASQQQMAAIANGEQTAQAQYGVMEELSAIGLMGAGPAGAAGAAALLSGALATGSASDGSDAESIEIADDVLQGLVEAGAMSSRYLIVKAGLDSATERQVELLEITRESPAAR